MTNPFTPRTTIKDVEQFIGRWRELSIIFERLESGRPVLIAGPPGVGKSSLLYHVTQAAGVQLDDDTLRAYYMDLALAEDADEVVRVTLQALGWSFLGRRAAEGGLAALEVALLETGDPLILCLDNADSAIAAGWGARLLEGLARLGRRSDLLLVAAVGRQAPQLSEPFSVVNLGALAATEARLLAEAYLSESEVRFTPEDLRAIYTLSAGHPAYLQRAAFHLYQSKRDPAYDWRAAYLREARVQPVVGAPLPPEVFRGETQRRAELAFSDDEEAASGERPLPYELPTLRPLRPLLPLLLVPLVYLLTGNLFVTLGALVVAVVATAILWRT